MKALKKWVPVSMVLVAVALTVTSCGALNSLSDKEAHDFGYGLGRIAGYYLNN